MLSAAWRRVGTGMKSSDGGSALKGFPPCVPEGVRPLASQPLDLAAMLFNDGQTHQEVFPGAAE